MCGHSAKHRHPDNTTTSVALALHQIFMESVSTVEKGTVASSLFHGWQDRYLERLLELGALSLSLLFLEILFPIRSLESCIHHLLFLTLRLVHLSVVSAVSVSLVSSLGSHSPLYQQQLAFRILKELLSVFPLARSWVLLTWSLHGLVLLGTYYVSLSLLSCRFTVVPWCDHFFSHAKPLGSLFHFILLFVSFFFRGWDSVSLP